MKVAIGNPRLLAVGLLGIVVATAAALLIWPIAAAYGNNADRIAAAERQLETYHRLVSSESGLTGALDRLKRSSPAAGYYVTGATPALASASMQKFVKDLTSRNRAEVISTQLLVADDAAETGEVGLKVHLRAELASAMTILHGLESGRPMLFVEDLVISARPIRATTPGAPPTVRLDMQFELVGYMKGSS